MSEKIIGPGGGSIRNSTLPDSAEERKKYPMAEGLLDYFPDALAAVAHVSWLGSKQHNPGMSTRWTRSKSGDEADTLMRHLSQRGTLDTDGERHSAKVAWRALALLQKEIESEGESLVMIHHKVKHVTNLGWKNSKDFGSVLIIDLCENCGKRWGIHTGTRCPNG